MTEIKANLYPCKHCNETGTCTSGKDGSSCAVCVKRQELKAKQQYFGIACGVCNGLGQGEPFTERLNKRIKPVLSILLVMILLVFIFALAISNSQYFTEFLAFAGTLLGSVTAFYFNNAKNPH